MITYQDLRKVSPAATSISAFCENAIAEYKASAFYRTAVIAEKYYEQKNVTITDYRKLLYTTSGKAVPDNYTANHKMASNFFKRFVVQENQYLLGNGATFEKEATKKKLGANFDSQLQKAGRAAITEGCAYGLFNYDNVQVFKAIEFVPLFDEENGSLRAGIRFWQLAEDKPLRYTLFEEDGYTEFIKDASGNTRVLADKKTYVQVVKTSIADGVEISDGGNYSSFPIVPLWGNLSHQSAIVGIREQIDAYDLIKSGFCNDLDDASAIYWTLQGAGGMDDIDLAKFVERMKTVKAAVVDDDMKAESHTLEVPYQSRETYLARLENDLYNDAMALNVQTLSAGNLTATAINAAYENLNAKTDEFEYCVLDFIGALLKLAGVEDYATFKRSKVINQQEETQMILSAASYLDDETILKKLPFLTPDEVKGILERKDAEDHEAEEEAKEENPEANGEEGNGNADNNVGEGEQ